MLPSKHFFLTLVTLSLLVIDIHAKETRRRDLVVDTATIVDDNITTNTNNVTTTTQIPSILDELLNWQIPDLTQGDPTIATPKQFTASCNMLCSVGWEEDITASTFTKINESFDVSHQNTCDSFITSDCHPCKGET